MTTEDDFWRQLEAAPREWSNLLVFADWLQEHDDPRAEGMRALGVNRRDPSLHFVPQNPDRCPYWLIHRGSEVDIPRCLPKEWFDELDVRGGNESCAPRWATRNDATYRELMDAAALAFAKLSAARRAQLLNPTVPT